MVDQRQREREAFKKEIDQANDRAAYQIEELRSRDLGELREHVRCVKNVVRALSSTDIVPLSFRRSRTVYYRQDTDTNTVLSIGSRSNSSK